MQSIRIIKAIPVANTPIEYRKILATIELLLNDIANNYCDIERLKLETELAQCSKL